MNKLFILICFSILFILPYKVNAECSDSETIRLSNISNNINISYIYNDSQKKFTIKFTNLTKEIIIKDIYNNKKYNVNDELIIKNYTSGNYKFNIYSNNKCSNEILNTKYIKLPYLNRFYDSDECKGIENYSYCNKWVPSPFEYDKFIKNINEYRNNLKKDEIVNKKNKENMFDKIRKLSIEIYANYYFIILPIFIGTLLIIIFVKRKNENLF